MKPWVFTYLKPSILFTKQDPKTKQNKQKQNKTKLLKWAKMCFKQSEGLANGHVVPAKPDGPK